MYKMKNGNGLKRTKVVQDQNESKRTSESKEKSDKQKRKRVKKRRSSSSPEEDIIDGFVITSFSSLQSLETVTSDISCGINGKHEEENISKSIEVPTKPVVGKPKKNITCNVEASSEKLNLTKCKANVTEIESFGQKSNGSKRLPGESIGQLTDDSSESGNSEKGYICDEDSEEEKVSKEKKRDSCNEPSHVDTKVAMIPVKVDLSQENNEGKSLNLKDANHTNFHSTSKAAFSQVSSISMSSASVAQSTQSSWPPRLTSFKKPLSVVEPSYGSTSFSGTDVLHQELNNRFLQSHSELERSSQNSKSSSQEMHQHSHLHHHQHQHQHTHYYPSPLLSTPYFPTPTPMHGVLSPFSTTKQGYSSRVIPPYSKKPGKWCAAHVHVAWKIYCHQRVQGELSKDAAVTHEGLSGNKPRTTTIIPPCSSRHMSSNDIGYHSSHLRRLSDSPFGKPPVLIPCNSPPTSVVTSSVSAFSSVSSPPLLTLRRPSTPNSFSRSLLETNRRRSPNSGASALYPWLKLESRTPELDSNRTREHFNKRESRTHTPPRPSNFSIQTLAGERTETVRPNPLRDTSRMHFSRELRAFDSRSFADNPLAATFGALDKRPIDCRPTSGSIDLSRNSLFPRLDPMHSLYSHHVTPMSSHIPSGYVYPSLADYHHPPPSHSMVLGTRDYLASFSRPADMPFYLRRDMDDRLGGGRR